MKSYSAPRAAGSADHPSFPLKPSQPFTIQLTGRWRAWKRHLTARGALAILTVSCLASAVASDLYLVEDFSTDPSTRGWGAFGDAGLFSWNAEKGNLEVTWDSSRPNSYYWLPLGRTLTRTNDFIVGFDLTLADVAIGTTPEKPYAMQMAIGLLNYSAATNTDFLRANGFSAPNLLELDFFPDSGYGDTLAGTIISTNNDYSAGGFASGAGFSPGHLYHVEMRFSAARQVLTARVTRDGERIGPVNEAWLLPPSTDPLVPGFSDFAVDHLAIPSYSDGGQDPLWSGSIRAHGTIDNVFIMVPPPIDIVSGGFSEGAWKMRVATRLGWTYRLERTSNWQDWELAGVTVSGDGSDLVLTDPAPPANQAFYRVRAQKE